MKDKLLTGIFTVLVVVGFVVGVIFVNNLREQGLLP